MNRIFIYIFVYYYYIDIYSKADLSDQEGTLRQKHVGSNNIVMTHEQQVWKRHRMVC